MSKNLDKHRKSSNQYFLYEGGGYQHRYASNSTSNQQIYKRIPTYKPNKSSSKQRINMYLLKPRSSLEWIVSGRKRNPQLNLNNFDQSGHLIHKSNKINQSDIKRQTPRSNSAIETNIIKILAGNANPSELLTLIGEVRIKQIKRPATGLHSSQKLAQKIIIKKREEDDDDQNVVKPLQTIKYIGVHNDQIGILSRKVSLVNQKFLIMIRYQSKWKKTKKNGAIQ